jgi:hypothetical protein
MVFPENNGLFGSPVCILLTTLVNTRLTSIIPRWIGYPELSLHRIDDGTMTIAEKNH